MTHTYANDGNFTISATVSDEDGSHAGAGTHAVTVDNMSPTITGGTSETVAAVNEDVADVDNPGSTVNSLFLSHYSDPADSFAGVGIVVNAANDVTEGDWQYSTDSGTTWNNISTTVAATSAVVIQPTDKLGLAPWSWGLVALAMSR